MTRKEKVAFMWQGLAGPDPVRVFGEDVWATFDFRYLAYERCTNPGSDGKYASAHDTLEEALEYLAGEAVKHEEPYVALGIYDLDAADPHDWKKGWTVTTTSTLSCPGLGEATASATFDPSNLATQPWRKR